MTNKETVHRNIGLVFDFVKQLIEDPELVNKLPDNSELNFLDKEIDSNGTNNLLTKSKSRSFVKVKNTFEISN